MISENFDLSLVTFRRSFSVNIVSPSVLSLSKPKLHQAVNNIFIQENVIPRLTFNLGLALTGFRTTRPRASMGFEPVTSAIPLRCSINCVCSFIAQLVEDRTLIAEVTGSNPVNALMFLQASSFQLLKVENLLR